ncbi:Hypothetical predicted protein [Octopus vulgaris]|uniref:chitin synthase n=1 Tax=Octopus vulgaris TaxID=6645 RepID=A0AA36B6W5_OCTVU|nr:Hypothetical predicted protein [Octopus vulgaris]
MELGKLQCLLKSNYNVQYENIDASSCKQKMHSEYSKAPIIQTVSNVLELLNKRQYSRYMTVNSELPFQITSEESSSEESGIQSIANAISVDSSELSPGITSEDDIIDASGNEDESTDVSSSNDDHTVINKEPVNSCIEKNNSDSLTLQVKNTRQTISQTDRTSSVSKTVSFPIMSPLVTCPDKSAPVPSTNCFSPIYNYSFDLTPKHFMIEKPFWNRKMQYDMKHCSKSTKQTENKRNSLNSSTEPISSISKPSPRMLPISYKAASEISQHKSSLNSSYFDDYTYILATDADMEFDDKSLARLIDLCNRDKNIGGACGRTSPIGHCNTPVVWYQKFEYAKGEDRWLCTLMMLKGWKLEYSSYSHNSTFCPDTFLEFLKQRKRWVLSEMSNLILVFGNIRRLTQNNSTFTLIYIIYILQMFLLVMLSPGTTVVVLTISLDILFGLSCLYTTPFCIGSLILYSVICSTRSIEAQSAVTSAITIFLGGIVLSVSVGYMKFFVVDTIDDLQDGQLQFKQYYLILLLMTAVLYAALIHPKEAWTLIHGLTFLVVFPAMYILLPFYAVSNIVDQRWGTRESDSDGTSCYRHMSDRLFTKEKSIKRQEIPESQQFNGERDLETCDPAKHILLQKEQTFWEDLRVAILGTDVNLGTDQVTLKIRLKILRNRLVGILLLCNIIWACLLSGLYLTISKHDTIFGIITCSVYSFSLIIQLIGLTAHKCDSFFREFVIRTFGKKHPIWIHRKD